jgi:single-strand DNA-binding protein
MRRAGAPAADRTRARWSRSTIVAKPPRRDRMASYNRIILVGNLTRDPELTYTPANTAVCKFGIATNRKWRDREGNQREDVCFIDCALFGKAGEVFQQYMTKGRSVLVEGVLQLNQWTTKEGEKRSRHQVLVDNFTFLGQGRGEGGAPERRTTPSGPIDEPAPTDDDIPF